MNSKQKTIMAFVFTIANAKNATAQFNTANNNWNKNDQAFSIQKNVSVLEVDTATAACSSVISFWGTDQATSELKEFEITTSTITYTGNSIPTCPGYSLAICNNLNGGSVSPTFYTSTGNQLFYWDGSSNWITGPPSPNYMPNACGNGNMLYFLDNSTTPTTILKYDGVNYTPFFSINKYSGFADLASDAIGNTYILTRDISGLLVSDSIVVIDTSGQIIQQYPFIIDVTHGYGSFITGNTLYLGFGTSNSVHPNSLVPVTFSGNTATAGAPIPFPAGIAVHNDLASCTPGLPLSVADISHDTNFHLSPNPVKDKTTISVLKFENVFFSVLDLNGKTVIPKTKLYQQNTSVDLSGLSNGVYFFEINYKNKTERKKFCKL